MQEAIKLAVITEKNAMNFYLIGARQLNDPGAKRLFEQLAKEERAHAHYFFGAYSGDDLGSFEEFMDSPVQYESVWFASLSKALEPDFSERTALEIAMEKEKTLEAALREKAATVTDARGRDIFEYNAKETHNHYLTIEAEYARLMAMVDESDMDTYVRE